MGVYSGELLALVSTPSFDPNAFHLGFDSRQWRALTRHPRAPLVHRAISGQYAPGSTFKMIVALAGLEAGDDPGRSPGVLLRPNGIRRPLLPLLEEGRPRRVVVAPRHRAILRYPFLRRRAPRRHRPYRRDGRAVRLRSSHRYRHRRRGGRPRAEPRMDAASPRPALASGRDAVIGNRSGLPAGHAAATRRHDGPDRERRVPGEADP